MKNTAWTAARKIAFLLALGCLAGTTVLAQPPESTSGKPPEDLPVTGSVVPVNAWEGHPGQNRKRLDPPAQATIHMRDVPPIDPFANEVRLSAPPQGGFDEGDKAVDLATGKPVRRSSENLPAAERPEIVDHNWMGHKAMGDWVASFEGIDAETDVSVRFPPDTVLAVGPDHVLEAVNAGFAIYSKDGTLVQSYNSFQNFFLPLEPTAGFAEYFDPRVIYDSFHDQWVMLVMGLDDLLQDSYVFIAVSSTADPTGNWFMYRYHVNTGDHSDAWLDYASLGADAWGVYFTGNYFEWSGDRDFKYSTIVSIGPDVFDGGSGSSWQFWNLRWPGLFPGRASSIQVAQAHSQSRGETFFVNTRQSSGNDILLWKLTGDRANSPSLSRSPIGMRSYDAVGVNNVDQPGPVEGLDGGDTRVLSAVYAQRRVYATLGTAPTSNSAGWITMRLNVDSTIREWDTLLWGGENVYYIYPAITISGGNSTCAPIGLTGSWTDSTTQFPSGLFKIYESCNSTEGPFVSFATGQGSYVRVFEGRNRWGDYSGAAYDWSTGNLWGAVEYAGTGNNWRTRITARQFVHDLAANFSSQCNGLTCNFRSTSSGGLAPYSYAWTFWDPSTTSSSSHPTHTFNSSGIFLVSLQITDATGEVATVSRNVTVEQPLCSQGRRCFSHDDCGGALQGLCETFGGDIGMCFCMLE